MSSAALPPPSTTIESYAERSYSRSTMVSVSPSTEQ